MAATVLALLAGYFSLALVKSHDNLVKETGATVYNYQSKNLKGSVNLGTTPVTASTLYMSYNDMDDCAANTFAQHPAVTLVGLNYNKFESSKFSPLCFKGSSIRVLGLAHNAFVRIPDVNTVGGTLTQLDLHANRIQSVAASDVSGLASLIHLNLDHNELGAVPDLGTAKASLKFLYLRHNVISSVPEGALLGLAKLEELRLDGNRLTAVPAPSTLLANNLVKLGMPSNYISSLDNIDAFKALTEFDISHNKLGGKNVVPKLDSVKTSLVVLKVAGNEQPNLEASLFSGFNKLEELDFSHNKISLFPDVTTIAQTLKRIDLRHNFIDNLDHTIAPKLTKLESLQLGGNKLSAFPSSAVCPLGTTLKELDVSGGFIRVVNSTHLSCLPKLEVLKVANSSLTALPPVNLLAATLREIDFSGNTQIHTPFSTSTISLMTQLTSVNLQNTKVSSFPDVISLGLNNLNYLDLRGTSLICDCIIAWMKAVPSSWNITLLVDTLPCTQPSALKSQYWSQMQYNSLCDESEIIQWNKWMEWSECTASCAGGLHYRIKLCAEVNEKECTNSLTSVDGLTIGYEIQNGTCNTQRCPINGGWGQWNDWGNCSSTCGPGNVQRWRYCDNPKPQYDGEDCGDHDHETKGCIMPECPIQGRTKLVKLTPDGMTESDYRPTAQATGGIWMILLIVEMSMFLVLDINSMRRHSIWCRKNIAQWNERRKKKVESEPPSDAEFDKELGRSNSCNGSEKPLLDS